VFLCASIPIPVTIEYPLTIILKVICSATLWVNPLAAPRSNFVCARILAQKHTCLPAQRTLPHGLY
jgi:hypothetical protein